MKEKKRSWDRPSGEEINHVKADGLIPLLQRTVLAWKNNFKTSLQVRAGKPRGHTQDSPVLCTVKWVWGAEGSENASDGEIEAP